MSRACVKVQGYRGKDSGTNKNWWVLPACEDEFALETRGVELEGFITSVRRSGGRRSETAASP